MGVETRQLSDIGKLGGLFDRAGIDDWLFGGWAVDFYVGEVTRAHEDIDLAVWLRDRLAIAGLLSADGWQHAPRHDEDGGTGYERDGVHVELTFLVEGDDGGVLIAFIRGTVMWSSTPFKGANGTLLSRLRDPWVCVSAIGSQWGGGWWPPPRAPRTCPSARR